MKLGDTIRNKKYSAKMHSVSYILDYMRIIAAHLNRFLEVVNAEQLSINSIKFTLIMLKSFCSDGEAKLRIVQMAIATVL